MKKMYFGLLGFLLVLTFTGTSMAELSWDTCSLQNAGPAWGNGQLIKTYKCGNARNNNKWLRIVYQGENSLATEFTAMALEKRLKVQAHFDQTNGAIAVMYLVK